MALILEGLALYGEVFVDDFQVFQALANYRGGIRSAVRALWLGLLDMDQFFDSMDTTIRNGIVAAWNEGAREVGVQPNELTPQERIAQQGMIISERSRIFEFGEFIEANSKANKGLLRTSFARAEAWILRAQDAKNRGVLSAKNDPKLKWIFDPAKENCRTCAALNGKIKRQSFWQRVGVRPQNPPNPLIECEGWRCGCQLVPTDEPLSRGRLPGLP